MKDLLPPADAEGYHFNSKYHVITDLSRFDELFDDIINNSSSYRTYMNCVQIFEMYTDDIWLDIPDSEVELQRLYHHQKYFTILNKLLTILYDSGDYDGVRKVAEKGLQIEPGHTYVEVDEKVAEFMEKERPKPARGKRKAHRNKAQYFLDAGDGIEEDTLIRLFHEEEQNDRLHETLEQAMRMSLTAVQYRRVHMRFCERKSYKVIAHEEGVGISTIESSIEKGIQKPRKYICKHSVN